MIAWAKTKDEQGLITMIQNNPEHVNYQDGEGNTPLLIALREGHFVAALYPLVDCSICNDRQE
jgi:ankyrin repeat protein